MLRKVAAILVGGRGTRLQPLISHVPKPLAPIGNKPFLFLLIEALIAIDYKNIVLLTGYRHEAMVDAFKDHRFDANIIFSRETVALDTAGAIQQARAHLDGYPEFLLLNGDTYLEDFVTVAKTAIQDESVLMGVVRPRETDRYGSIQFDLSTGRITGFFEKQAGEALFVNAGIYKFSHTIFSSIPIGQAYSLERELFPKLLANGAILRALPLVGTFYDIGLPESYLEFVRHKGEQCITPY